MYLLLSYKQRNYKRKYPKHTHTHTHTHKTNKQKQTNKQKLLQHSLLEKLEACALDRDTLCWVKNWLEGWAQRVVVSGVKLI